MNAPMDDPDILRARGLSVRYVPALDAQVQDALRENRPATSESPPPFRSDAARKLHRLLDAHDWRTQRGCPNCQQTLRSAELWCLDAREQYDRFVRTRGWLIAVGAIAVAELVVIAVLSAVVLGWGG